MKKIRYIASLLAVAFCVTSCEVDFDMHNGETEMYLSDITEWDYPECNTWIILDEEATFDDFEGLRDALGKIHDKVTYQYINYYDNRRPISLKFPNLKSFPSEALYDDRGLSVVSISADVATSVGSYAFVGCYDLNNIDLPSATWIGTYALTLSKTLRSMTLATNKGVELSYINYQALGSYTSYTGEMTLTIGSLSSSYISDSNKLTSSTYTVFNNSSWSKSSVTWTFKEITVVDNE